ncbi:hypothetical protein KAM333_38390 [Aeromonas caviae]|nr:hypothetical protein KAM333_38390 [Aeromonas caviae]
MADAEIQGGAPALAKVAVRQIQGQINTLPDESPLVSVGKGLILRYGETGACVEPVGG